MVVVSRSLDEDISEIEKGCNSYADGRGKKEYVSMCRSVVDDLRRAKSGVDRCDVQAAFRSYANASNTAGNLATKMAYEGDLQGKHITRTIMLRGLRKVHTAVPIDMLALLAYKCKCELK